MMWVGHSSSSAGLVSCARCLPLPLARQTRPEQASWQARGSQGWTPHSSPTSWLCPHLAELSWNFQPSRPASWLLGHTILSMCTGPVPGP